MKFLLPDEYEEGYEKGYGKCMKQLENIISVLIDKNKGEFIIYDIDIANTSGKNIVERYDQKNKCSVYSFLGETLEKDTK